MPDRLAHFLESMLDFSNVLNASISASWLILLVMALRLVLKRAPKWVNVALWGIVAARLLMPVSIESAVSLVPSAQTVSDQLLQAEAAAGQQSAFLDIVTNPAYGGTVSVELDRTVSTLQWELVDVTFLWLAGMAAMAFYTAVTYWRLRTRVSTAVILRDNIFQSEGVASPFVLGIVKPRIYLPFGMEVTELTHVIAHERAHIRRRDHWWKPLGFWLLTIHWFNPLMWAAYVLLCRDIELACDEKVIRELGSEQRADYTQALLAASINRRMIAACPLAFGEVGVKERVKNVMNYRKPAFWVIVTAVVVCVVVAVCFLTDPKPAPEFPMSGDNISDLAPEEIVERIMEYQDIENSNVYMNSDNFSLTVDADFDWYFDQTISYFYFEDQKTQSAQLRMFPYESEYYLTEAREWPEQNRIFLLRHYLDALKYLPQEAVRELAPADRYLIEHFDGGSPDGYERVITYSANGVGVTDGWYIHLEILPLHEDGEGYSGTGDEVVHLFYGDKSTEAAARVWFEMTDWNAEQEYAIDEFPGVTFYCSSGQISVGDEVLISGMPIWNAYLCDLTGDGYPEICAQTSFGSGMIDERVLVYDYANGVSYELEDRGHYDYCLRMNGADGQLYVDKKIYMKAEVTDSGRLIFRDGSLQIDGDSSEHQSILRATVLEIHDGYFLVQPVEGSWELRSADRIEVPMVHMESSPEPQVGDVLEITYDGQLAEVYPARITKVSHIQVVEPAIADEVVMLPTDTNLKGLQAGTLLVPMDGQTYRYLLKETDPEGVTVDKLLFSFQQPDMGESVQHEVYSLKEYPDRSRVLLISHKNGPWLCEYSPPQRCSDTALTDALEAGYVVMEDGIATHGQDIWHEFYELTQKGKKASVAIAQYHTLNPDRCDSVYYEIFKQDYPCLYVHQLSYDGKQFILSFGAEATRTYEYLMKYEFVQHSVFSSVVPQYRYHYVLTHDNRYTYDQLWQSIVSSQAGAYIDHYTIYSEPKQ